MSDLKVGDIVRIRDSDSLWKSGGFYLVDEYGKHMGRPLLIVTEMCSYSGIRLAEMATGIPVYGSCWGLEKKEYSWSSSHFEHVSAFERDALNAILGENKCVTAE